MRLFLIVLFISINSYAVIPYNQFFCDNTMRVDYYHTGTSSEEYFSLDQVYKEALWPGSRTVLIDSTNLGEYMFRVVDLKTNQIIFSRGYCTIFGEWQTTQEALDGVYRTMSETIRFPFPKDSVQVVIAKRDKKTNTFVNRFSTVIDPASRFVNKEVKTFPFKQKALIKNGNPNQKVDILILADGYTKAECSKFRTEAEHYVHCLFQKSPFSKHKNDFNVWIIEAISTDSGIDDPRKNKWRDNIIGTSYNTFDLPRYALSMENRQIHDIASQTPYDFIVILFNSSRYGGGGIYNCQATCYTGAEDGNPAWWSEYVFVHEFGHLFAGLGDEYYSSDVAYQDFYPQGIEPWEPNLTRLLDSANIKWRSLISADTPIPTPWPKAEYDSLSIALGKEKVEAHREELKKKIRAIFTSEQNPQVGCYEGAGYTGSGMYRPALDCIMFSKGLIDFCPVCQAAIEKMIKQYTK